ncbi:MAG: hypothetical protein JWO03_1276 [Bacteroidetes bacterium]|nr:hypothetical protein [Bacteroidota bacterium]
MKRIILALLSVLIITAGASAQHCSVASVNIPTHPGTFAGLSPLPWDLPCMVAGQPVSDTIYFHNFDTVYIGTTMVIIDSLKLDSIGNLPAGLCWVSNKANNTFAGGEDGIIYVQGTCSGAAGQYKMKILFEAQTNIGQLPYGSDAETYAGLRYYVRVRCATAGCTALDTITGRTNDFIPYPTCPGPPPAVITAAGSTNICPGASVILSASYAAGYRYRWSTGATTDSITVTAPGSYVVTVYNGPDSTVSAATVVTFRTPPGNQVYPSNNVTLCPGDTLPLAAIATGVRYAWSTGDTTQVLMIATAGHYTLTVTDSYGCTAVSAIDTITTATNPVALILPNGLTLTAGSGTGYTYQWYRNDTLLTSETGQSITVTVNGSYTVLVTNTHGCHAVSTATSITTVGIRDLSTSHVVTLYPNPSEGLFTLSTSGRTGDSYEIHDAIGSIVQQHTIAGDRTPVDISVQPSGVYTLTVKHGATSETVRFTLIR